MYISWKFMLHNFTFVMQNNPQSIHKNFLVLNQRGAERETLQWIGNLFSHRFSFSGSMQSWEAPLQILSSPAASEGSIIDKRAQSFSVEERSNAADGHATKRPTDNHKSDAADGELLRKITGCRFY